MATLNKIFFRGFVTIIPLAVTLYLLYWIISLMEGLVGRALIVILPSAYYVPGLGVLATITLIFFWGLLLNNFVLSEIVERVEKRLKSVPFIKAIYSPLRDLMNLFSKESGQGMKSVVLVNVSEGVRILGVVTRENFRDLPNQLHDKNLIAVYCPWSYGMGGFTLLVNRNQVEEVDIPIEKAMSLAITGWVKADKNINREDLK